MVLVLVKDAGRFWLSLRTITKLSSKDALYKWLYLTSSIKPKMRREDTLRNGVSSPLLKEVAFRFWPKPDGLMRSKASALIVNLDSNQNREI
jgi:hypothetical protein